MAATYTDTLPTNKDHVRFLINDTDVDNAELTDEEIAAVLSAETASNSDALKYFAAARCLEVLLTKYSKSGKGVMVKKVSKLRVERGIDRDPVEALRAQISSLRKRGAFLEAPTKAKFFTAV